MTEPSTILVCGGAGYIGSHMCKALARAGHPPVTLDNFSTGHRWAVKWGPVIEADLLDQDALRGAFETHRFDAVMHFAVRSLVSESVQQPGLYFRNNPVNPYGWSKLMAERQIADLHVGQDVP